MIKKGEVVGFPYDTHHLDLKPMSVNVAWQGRRYKTDTYKKYEKDVLTLLSAIHIDIPTAGDLKLILNIGCTRTFDIDNAVKPLVDILQKKYDFNDNRIIEAYLTKKITKRGEEYMEFNLLAIKDSDTTNSPTNNNSAPKNTQKKKKKKITTTTAATKKRKTRARKINITKIKQNKI